MKRLFCVLLGAALPALAETPSPQLSFLAAQNTGPSVQEKIAPGIHPVPVPYMIKPWQLQPSPAQSLLTGKTKFDLTGKGPFILKPNQLEAVCSIPLRQVLPKDYKDFRSMPQVKPGPTEPMPQVKLPAPPCKE